MLYLFGYTEACKPVLADWAVSTQLGDFLFYWVDETSFGQSEKNRASFFLPFAWFPLKRWLFMFNITLSKRLGIDNFLNYYVWFWICIIKLIKQKKWRSVKTLHLIFHLVLMTWMIWPAPHDKSNNVIEVKYLLSGLLTVKYYGIAVYIKARQT